MSGYLMYILVDAESREDATKTAEDVIDNLWESHDLVEGDNGYVAKDGEVLNLKDCGKEKLQELNKQRAESVRKYIRDAIIEAMRMGYQHLEDVPPCEEKDSMVGHDLRAAGIIMEGFFTPRGVVYDPAEGQCGFTEKRIAELMKEPEKWWLVETIVG